MKITLIAASVAAVIWIIFMLLDKKNKGENHYLVHEEEDTKSSHVDIQKNDGGKLSLEKKPTKQKKQKQEKGVIDYSTYKLSKQEYFLSVLVGAIFFFLIGLIFYMNIVAALVLASVGLLFPKMRKKQMLLKRQKELSGQFKQALFSISSALSAGKSVENAFRDVVEDLKLLYPDPNTYIIREFELINRRIANGETIERTLYDFGERSGLEDIQNFADVFITCKRSGGNLIEVIRRTSTIIADKLEIEQDISILVANKKFEAKILMLAPVGMVAMMEFTAKDYMSPLFQFPGAGPVIMTVCLAVLGFVYWMLQRIMDIKV